MSHTKHSIILAIVIATFGIFCTPATASAASYNLTTDKETFAVGGTFNVDVKLDSADVGVNAAQATITFPKDTVQVTAVDKSNSVFDFWLQGPSYSNETGEVSFIGGSQSGVSGKALEVLRITFRVKGSGAVSIIFSDGAVTASDGSGTNVLSAMNGLQLTSATTQEATVIKPPPQIVRPVVPAATLPEKPTISIPLYPKPDAWNAVISKFVVQWDLPRTITEVATAINQQPLFDPTKSEGLFNNKTFSPLSDGVWYLHVRFKNSVGWGPTAHYRIGVDSIPPLGFAVTSPNGLTTANVAPTIAYSSSDQLSGVVSYKIFIDGELATTTALTTYTVPPQQPGDHAVLVQAVDGASNATESRATLSILEIPLITIAGIGITKSAFFISLIFVLAFALVLGGGLGWYIGLKEREQRGRRIVIAQRDVQTTFDSIQKDVSNLILKMGGESLTAQAEHEMKVVLERISDNIKKNKQYVVENMEDIES